MSSSSVSSAANPMWGGHYDEAPAAAFAAINPSIGFDWRLYAHDIKGSIAHATMLAQCGIISAEESAAICKGLEAIRHDIEAGRFTFDVALEDIHMNIEAELKNRIGEAAGKLHTARSRNDQVATAFRLYVRDALSALDEALKQLQAALIDQAERHHATLMPGFTHLQAAQPISFGHHLMAYVEMFGRDRTRLADAALRMNECPLGAAALAGTTYPIDRHATAEALGFTAPMANSLDAVSDRDFVLEPLAAMGICATHLSRLSEELVLWMTPAFGFVSLPESFTSGSSIMPQKRNPDAAELIRGKTGRIATAFSSLLIVMKGLPLAYNKDMQEDKEPFFDAHDQLMRCITAMRGMIEGMQPNHARMEALMQAGFLNATDLADWLVQQLGLAFREAHHITGRIVKLAESRVCALEHLPLDALQSIEPRIHEGVFEALSLAACVARRDRFGGTAPQRVMEAIGKARTQWL